MDASPVMLCVKYTGGSFSVSAKGEPRLCQPVDWDLWRKCTNLPLWERELSNNVSVCGPSLGPRGLCWLTLVWTQRGGLR